MLGSESLGLKTRPFHPEIKNKTLWTEEDGPIRGERAAAAPPWSVAVLYLVYVCVMKRVCVNTVQTNYFKKPVGCCWISYSSFCLVASVFLLLLI